MDDPDFGPITDVVLQTSRKPQSRRFGFAPVASLPKKKRKKRKKR